MPFRARLAFRRMTSLTVQSCLEKNLAALGKRNADLAEKLASASPHAGLVFESTPDGVPAATLHGRQLSSKHRPLEEASRLASDIDLIEHAAVIIMGFGLGYHVQKLAERAEKCVMLVAFEPDLALLRSVLETIDHSRWLKDALLLVVTDPNDRGDLARKLDGSESILAQGIAFLEHPASRVRLESDWVSFKKIFSDYVTAAKTTLATTLMRSAETARNLMLNLDHYAGGAGISELADAAKGFPAVVVSAGPSLQKNIAELAAPGVRDRCIIIAVQTALKPLLAAGVRPHFVTALDYHEISKRFYEDLEGADLTDVTLIADPKAHPVILDIFPGPVRCCASDFLDRLLGPHKREMGALPAGATVAHLAMYVARYLGCEPIALIGQDLGFPDGLYYAPGTAIHNVWAPELNPFNTIAMMEWQRIARHRLHLLKATDIHGRPIYTDAQMHTYLQQFERDFARYESLGATIIDATEGGVAKQHTRPMPLREFLATFARSRIAPLPQISSKRHRDHDRLKAAGNRIAQVRAEVIELRKISQQTESLLRDMLDHQLDAQRMALHFKKIERYRKQVEQRFQTFELINHLNQMGVFKRLKADRKLHLQRHLDALARQRGQLERDLANVTWIADAAQEFLTDLEATQQLLKGESVADRRNTTPAPAGTSCAGAPSRIAALIPVDLSRNGLGIKRSLATRFGASNILQSTLERLGESKRLEGIILIAAQVDEVESLINRSRIGLPVMIEPCAGSPFGPEQRAIAAARLWAAHCWRGGIAGMSIYDEALSPRIMYEIMQRRGFTAALIVGPDWPLIDISSDFGCDAVITRHLSNPQQHNLVFTQAPPGLCGCLIGVNLMKELSLRNRLSTVGGLLVYQPHAPQHDAIAREANVQLEPQVRHALVRGTCDSPARCDSLSRTFGDHRPRSSREAVQLIEQAEQLERLPRHVVIEITPHRASHGLFKLGFGPIRPRERMSIPLARRIIDELAPESLVSFAGGGDPLLHPEFDAIAGMARDRGMLGIHLRTEMLAETAVLQRLLNCGVEIVSVDLNADRAATYRTMMGLDLFKTVLMNIDWLIQHRTRLTNHPGSAAFALPWIVPHLQRRAETYEDIDTFYDRWQHALGTVVVDDPPRINGMLHFPDSLTPALTPPQVIQRNLRTTMLILSDGSVSRDWRDCTGTNVLGSVVDESIAAIWHQHQHREFDLKTA